MTEGVAPELYPNQDQMSRAEGITAERISATDLSSDLGQFGVDGSPTWVDEIRLVEPNRLGVLLENAQPGEAAKQVVESVRQRLAELDVKSVNPGVSVPLPRYPDTTDRSIWVVAETTNHGLAHVTLEMLGKARELTQQTMS